MYYVTEGTRPKERNAVLAKGLKQVFYLLMVSERNSS